MPCDQCTDPARCNRFGVCQQFRHTLPAGSYEQRIKELAPELGMPRAMARADMEARECRPGSVCSRSIRGLGGCEAGSCEREEGAGGVMASHTDQRQVREDSQGLGEPGRLSPIPPHLQRAQAEVAAWPPERLRDLRLQGSTDGVTPCDAMPDKLETPSADASETVSAIYRALSRGNNLDAQRLAQHYLDAKHAAARTPGVDSVDGGMK